MAKKSTKPIIFISHITAEKKIADAFADLIRREFKDMVEVFVSSIPLGREWFDRIKTALLNCELAIVLASPESVKRPWINFESGAAWGLGKIVIPLCHSGISKNTLPDPLKHLQGTDAADSDGLQQIINDIARVIGATPGAVEFSEFMKLVSEFEATSEASEELKEHALLPPTSGLSAIQVAVLQAAAEDLDSLTLGTTAGAITREMGSAGFKVAAATIAMKILEREEYLTIRDDQDYNSNYFQRVALQEKAWKWLEANQDKISFRNPPKKAKVAEPNEADFDPDVPF